MQQDNRRGGQNLSQPQQNFSESVISRAFSIAASGQHGAPPIFSTTAIGGAPVGGVHHHLLPGQVGQMVDQALPTAAYFESPAGDLSSVGNAAMQGPEPQGIPASVSGSQQRLTVGVSAADYYQQYGLANAAANVPTRQKVLAIQKP
jgi:hypothetical protein